MSEATFSRQSVDAVARVKARELGGDRTLVTETGFQGHLPALPPARQIDDRRPAGRDDLLRNLVGNGTHRVLPVGFARGAPPSTGNIAARASHGDDGLVH